MSARGLLRPVTAAAIAICLNCATANDPSAPPLCVDAAIIRQIGYHGGPSRTGWNDDEVCLTPARVSAGIASLWSSAPLDSAVVDGTPFSAHGYATPLYIDDVVIGGVTRPILLVATSSGFIYAIATTALGPTRPGDILWRRSLGDPAQPARAVDGVPFGVLSTPTVDLQSVPPRVYVTCADRLAGWGAFALDLADGSVLPGWPVGLSDATLGAVDKNAPMDGAARATMGPATTMSQRSALALAPGGDRLYVSWGAYIDGAVGWMAAIDTRSAKVTASFSGAPHDVPHDGTPGQNRASGGMWGAGGPSVDADGRVFMTTGNSPEGSSAAPGVWGNSALAWSPALDLVGAYTPFDYCRMDQGDTDLGGSSPVLIDLGAEGSATPHLIAFGGKQGNVYLVDRDRLPVPSTGRPPCDSAHLPSPSSDASLLGPNPRRIYVPPARGPLNVFGPYSDVPGDNALNRAKMRSTPAFWRNGDGHPFLFVSGSSRLPGDLETPHGPSLARLRIVAAAGAPAYLEVDGYATSDVALKNPGAPVVTSHGGRDGVVWVLDANAARTAPLVPVGAAAPPPALLYAFDADSLALLARVDLGSPSGKYNHPAVAHGVVYTVTDRVTAWGAR